MAHEKQRPMWLRPLQFILVVAATTVILYQLKNSSSDFAHLKQVRPLWLALAFCFIVASTFFSGFAYRSLSPKPVRFSRIWLIQVANLFANRLLPSGLGSLGLNTLFLAKELRLTKTEAATVASLDDLIGFLGFVLLLSLISAEAGQKVSWSWNAGYIIAAIAVLLIILVAALLGTMIKKLRRKLVRSIGLAAKMLSKLIRRPRALLQSLLGNMAVSVCYVGALLCSVHAAGATLTFVQAFLVFAAGNAVLAISPTPGGIGTTEVAIAAALGAAGLDGPTAVLTVVGFRISSFWLPMLPGFAAFRTILSRKYV